ncbi:MAG: cutinase family protein [Mycobacterium sp.]
MSGRWVARLLNVAIIGLLGLSVMFASPQASAGSCPDIEVVFARGSGEPPGIGGVGQAFVDEVRARAGGKSVGVYAVKYAASTDFSDRPGIARTVAAGIGDERAHLESMAASCPKTRLVLGGFSQGAALTGMATSSVFPSGLAPALTPPPLPPDVAEHVAAVVFFGKPSGELLPRYSVRSISVSPLYRAKTLDLCAPGDAVCEGILNGPRAAHRLYPVNGMVGRGATYAVGLL